MKTISSQQYLSFLGSFGLSVTDDTGGQQIASATDCDLSLVGELPTLSIAGGDPIVFLNAELFLYTIKATENSLKVRLFN